MNPHWLDAKKQLIEIAADALEANPLDIDLGNKVALIQGTPSKTIPIKNLIKRAYEKGKPESLPITPEKIIEWLKNSRERS